MTQEERDQLERPKYQLNKVVNMSGSLSSSCQLPVTRSRSYNEWRKYFNSVWFLRLCKPQKLTALKGQVTNLIIQRIISQVHPTRTSSGISVDGKNRKKKKKIVNFLYLNWILSPRLGFIAEIKLCLKMIFSRTAHSRTFAYVFVWLTRSV